MATPNVGILTNAGKNLIDRVNAGQTKITFSKIVFSSMNNNQLTDDQIKALTTVTPQEIVVKNPEVTLDNSTGETRIRATGNNEALTDGVYVKTYAVYAKDDSSHEILYGITVSPNPNYLPEYDGVTPQAVTYSYKVNISNTTKITFTNSNDVYVSDTDLDEALQPYAKTVDVNQQLDKKVNVADMRRPAREVAGIEEVNAKQDKIGYTPADDSKVVHDNHDGTEQLNGVQVQPFNKLSDTIGGRNLLIGTSGFIGWTLSGNTAQGTTDGLTYAHLFINTSAVAPNFTLAESTTYTVSFDALGYSAGTAQIFIGYSEDSNGKIIASDYVNAKLNALDGASVRVSLTFTTPSSFTKTNFNIGCGYPYDTGGSTYIRHVKLEQGSIATDWTPAPEDKADDSKVVHSTDMRKPASDVAGIEEVNAKQDKIGYTPADDSKVAHLSGANNFDTVPTVNNNPLLLASSLPSDLARTGSNQEFTGKNTFDTAPIDKTTGNPYITKDGVPSDVARTSQQTNFTAGLQSGGVDVATAADLKSIEASAWRELDNKYIVPASGHTLSPATTILYKIDDSNHKLYLSGSIALDGSANGVSVIVQLGSIIKSMLTCSVPYLGLEGGFAYTWSLVFAHQSGATDLTFVPVKGVLSIASTSETQGKLAFVTYDKLV